MGFKRPQQTTTEEAEAEGATMVADKEGENREFEEIGARTENSKKLELKA